MKYYVSKLGKKKAKGSKDDPFLTINQAAQVAGPGDKVIVGEGVYREWVDPKYSGKIDARITYRAAKGAKVVITGAEVVAHWEKEENIWRAEVDNKIFTERNPFATKVFGDWFFDRDKGYTLGEVYLNGKSLYEALSKEGVITPVEAAESRDKEASLSTWYAEVGEEKTIIWANFRDTDPNQACVEINVRPYVFWPSKTGVSYITVKGFILKQAAPQWAPPTALQEGLIGPHWSKGWIIEDNLITDSKCTGISLGKEIGTGDNEFSHTDYKGGTQREREVIFRALHDAGWSKENVGGHIVRNNIIEDCEQAAIVGHLGAAFSLIENNHIRHIHRKWQWHGAEVAGIKFHAAIDTIITGNIIHDCYRGIWLDWQAQGTRLTANVLYDNHGEDLMVEVCHGPYLVDHNLFLSDWALKDMSQGGAFVHNYIQGKIAASTEHTRYTPYHFPHETAVYGVANIHGGDNRFYNNIFLRMQEDDEKLGLSNFWDGAVLMDGVPSNATFMQTPVGISQYDTYPAPGEPRPEGFTHEMFAKLPIYAAHNLYLGNASPYHKEEGAIVSSEKDAIVIQVIDAKRGTISVEIRNPELLDTRLAKMITSERLGINYQTEMGYVQGDGSNYLFDEDLLGNERTLVTVGPFEIHEKTEIVLVDGKMSKA